MLILRLLGWKVEANAPAVDKYVLVGAPHTSNWDFLLALLAMPAMGIRFNWVAKHTLFIQPLGFFLRLLGGIPVDRRASSGFVNKAVELFNKRARLTLTISPEGTRSRTEYWKTGFYQIALQARVPIALGYIDYKKKVLGIGASFRPSGDIEKDFKIVRKFYRDKTGMHPELQGVIKPR